MRTKIKNSVDFHGMSIRVERFLQLWAEGAGRQLKVLPFKRDLTTWNDGLTSMQPKQMVACYQWSKHDGDICAGVYEIWERKDGFSIDVYKFDTLEQYNDYNPSQQSPAAIQREIGLCENYHTGI
jgi:hypothetical protein